MSLCLVSLRFYPVIGGVETNFKNIAEYCSSFFKITVVTSLYKNIPKNILENYVLLKKQQEIFIKNIRILRSKPPKNIIINSLFYFNQFINKKIELFINSTKFHFHYKTNKVNLNFLMKSFILQRLLSTPNFLQTYFILGKINNLQKIDLIHSAPIHLTANSCAFQFTRKKNIPFIFSPFFHINPYSKFIISPSDQYILKKSEAIIANTILDKTFYQKFGVKEKKIHIIPPGINPKNYVKPNIKLFKEKNKIPDNAPILFFLGRKTYGKGLFHSIYVLKYLLKKFKDIRLIIAGSITKEFSIFFKEISTELKKHIIDLGLIDEETKVNAFASCDVFLLPSLDDSFGIVYLEAWLFKKPVIGALEGSVAGLIDNNINGYLVPFKNIKILAQKIEYLLKNKKVCEEFGQNGYNKLMNNYILEITNKKILNLYEKFI